MCGSGGVEIRGSYAGYVADDVSVPDDPGTQRQGTLRTVLDLFLGRSILPTVSTTTGRPTKDDNRRNGLSR